MSEAMGTERERERDGKGMEWIVDGSLSNGFLLHDLPFTLQGQSFW